VVVDVAVELDVEVVITIGGSTGVEAQPSRPAASSATALAWGMRRICMGGLLEVAGSGADEQA
jgi:hypothetical protein